MNKNDAVDELLTRGVAEVIGKEELLKKLRTGKELRVKLGIDPTSPNLHIGRGVVLMKLRDFQQLGHQVVFIIGDFTGVIGDTSDKDSERPMLTKDIVKKNLASYKEQASKLLDMKKVEFHFNSEWLAKLGFWEICEMADVFSLSEFVARENIKRRLDAGTRVSLRELLYPLMQGYDSVMIKSDIELGGTDQRFNMLAGRDLQRNAGQDPQAVITMDLILGTDGRKMSSSWGNTINVTDTPDDMFGKVMSIPDELIISYLIHCTRAPMEDVALVEEEMKKGALNPRDAKMRLAREIVTLYHGEEVAQNAEQAFVAVFQKKELPDEMPTFSLKKKTWNIVDLLVETALASSKSEARRVIAQGGVTIDGKAAKDTDETVEGEHIIKKGKRHFVKTISS
ncbi:MAG: tyrosine--tRNA ligase [Patescibacteria group bacterium]